MLKVNVLISTHNSGTTGFAFKYHGRARNTLLCLCTDETILVLLCFVFSI